jgi:TolA-binding protein
MMRYLLPIALALLTSCAHLGTGRTDAQARLDLWNRAHVAFAEEDFATAEQVFERLAVEHPETSEGRESLFYLGTIRLDPRNPAWDPEPAEVRLRTYLAADTLPAGPVHRRPEAQTLLQFAVQLNLPPDQRVAALQPQQVPAAAPAAQRRVVAPAQQVQTLTAEVDRLRREVAQRDEQIRTQREELERIRRTLAPRRD